MTDLKKNITTVLIVSLIVIIGLALWYTLRKNIPVPGYNQPERTLPIEDRLLDIPEAPDEAETIYSYSGQVKSISIPDGNFVLATTRGNKTIFFDTSTRFLRQVSTTVSPDNPPAPEQIEQDLISVSSLSISSVVKVTSLTNIRGLDSFKADSILLIE